MAASAQAPIAIVGIGCRFPGGVDSPISMWELLATGRDAMREVPGDRWCVDALFDPDAARRGKISTREAGFIDEMDRFDAELFGISAREAAHMDPQHRLLLEVAWAAVEDSGRDPRALAGSDAAVFVGLMLQDYLAIRTSVHERELIDAQTVVGMGGCMAANRISHALDLRGPSVVLDTACSSSLVAVHLACQSIRSGDASLALVGGVNLMLRPEPTIAASQARMLAPDGRCKGFDARADGYARSEGAGVVVLRPLEQALAAGERVYAVILGSAVNQDGRTRRVTLPSARAQQEVVRVAARRAGISPADLQYVEAHGTGTPVGDPIEAQALGQVLGGGREGPACALGSVKSNIGHAEAAAGVAALIKTALALEHGQIPPHLHFRSAPESIDLAGLGLRIPTSLEPWPAANGRRLAGINTFGLGGTNAHLILEGAPPPQPDAKASPASEAAQLFVVSGRTRAQLDRACARLAAFLRGNRGAQASLADLSLSTIARAQLEHRVACVARSRDELASLLDTHLAGESHAELFYGVVPEASDPGAEAEPALPIESGEHPAARGVDDAELAAADQAPAQREGLLRGLARLYVRGVPARLVASCTAGAKLTSLPSYPFAGQRYWIESPRGRELRLGLAQPDAAPLETPVERAHAQVRRDAPVSSGNPEARVEARVEARMREQVAQVLEMAPTELDVDRPLASLGLDSGMALDLAEAIEQCFSVRLPIGRILDGPSITELAAWVERDSAQATGSGALQSLSRPATARMRLLCIPYAGGLASVFRPWAKLLPEVELWAVRLPGSLDREREPPFEQMRTLVSALLDELDKNDRILEPPFALYGHSLGALVALALARELQARGRPGPSSVCVAAHPSPGAEAGLGDLAGLDADEFDARLSDPAFLRGIGYLDDLARFASDEALTRALRPALRAAFRLQQDYRPPSEPRLTCPLFAYVGAEDRAADEASMRGWAAYGGAGFRMRRFAGGHLFLRGAAAELACALREDLGLDVGLTGEPGA
ncbi:Malonyl CoA-acyl carrier protein transacylase [Enhygromyxa salina]|uniref:Malonyl CoA-acyl carrier protein transacylase n=1 Tax=Enhygromyxa salina TaxID=215803 RepID=A0A0C2DCZ1_9BACT|nr:beta-ketoacyl synthase N-terminal-like domain-containing protein [Enhygromyxa salina]KIG17577.1 Malonyl CoA-acyl carrier protein transacylase [Enhygromyxa salina]